MGKAVWAVQLQKEISMKNKLYLMQVDVSVLLKRGIADAEAETVKRSLNLLGIDVREVRVSKVYSLFVDTNNEQEALRIAKEACEKLLANPVINDFEIEVKHD